MTTNRRKFIKSGLALGATTALAGTPVFAQSDRIKLTYATLKTGVSVIFNEYLKAKRPDLDNGLEIEITNEYTSVSSYYSDFISGTFELGIGAWDTFLKMHTKAVPIRLVSSITTGTMINIVAREDGPATVEDLKGRSLSGIAASGAFSMCKAALSQINGLDLDKDVTVQNVPSPAQAMTLLLSKNVDAALSWEPNVSIAMSKSSGLKPIFNLGEAYEKKQGAILPYFAYAVRDEAIERDAQLATRLRATIDQLLKQINDNPKEAFEIAAPHLNVDPGVLMGAYEAGRLQFNSQSMLEQDGRDLVRKANSFFKGQDAKIDDAFFAS